MDNRLLTLTLPIILAFLSVHLLTKTVSAAPPPQIVIHEIAWAGTTNSSADEWIELFNPSDEVISLNGWQIMSSDGSPSTTLTGVIPANGYFLLERTDDTSAAPTADHIYTGGLSNSGEQLLLIDDAGQQVDIAGDGGAWFAGDSPNRFTMVRTGSFADGSVASSWIDGVTDGTPTNSIVDSDNDTYGYSPNIDWLAGNAPAFEQLGEDCDDGRNDTYPNAPELLDIIDNDCDSEIDEDFVLGQLDYDLYFNSDNLYAMRPTTATNALETALLTLINSAETSLDAAIYGFSRASVRDALIAAQQRGVQVRIAADYGEYHGTSRTWPFTPTSHNFIASLAERDVENNRSPAFFQQLEQQGILVYPSNYVSYLQHNKFAIIDGNIVWTGSTNWTDTGISVNMNNALVLRSEYIAQAYQIEFDEMVAGNFATAKEDDTPHTFQFENAKVQVYFSPSDDVESKVIDVMTAAQTSMHFSMFFWTSDTLGDLAVTKYITDNLEIKGIWDAIGARNAFSEDEKMCNAGIPLKIEIAGGKAHNKFAAFDWNGANPVVVTGSYNWTTAGAESNDENTLIISGNADIARRYYEEVMLVYNALPPATICGNISPESGIAACSNGRDDDFDNFIDENDFNCRESTVATCTDGQDNDEDGDVDSADLDCWLYDYIPTNVGLTTQKIGSYTDASVLLWFMLFVGTGCIFWRVRQRSF